LFCTILNRWQALNALAGNDHGPSNSAAPAHPQGAMP
jgi:hypothetical protein